QRAHRDAVALPHVDQAETLEDLDRLADRGAVDAELRRQLALRRQLLACSEAAVEDGIAQLLRHRLVQPASGRWAEGHDPGAGHRCPVTRWSNQLSRRFGDQPSRPAWRRSAVAASRSSWSTSSSTPRTSGTSSACSLCSTYSTPAAPRIERASAMSAALEVTRTVRNT